MFRVKGGQCPKWTLTDNLPMAIGALNYTVFRVKGENIMKNIGIQKELSTVKNYLDNNGYKTFEVDTTNKNSSTTLKSFDALIVTGMDDNEMGFDNTATKIPVVNADGMTPEDVKNFLDTNLK